MKRLLYILCLVLCGCVLCSCSGLNDVNLKDFTSEFNSEFALTDVTVISDVKELESFYNISSGDVKQFSAEYKTDSANGYTEVIMVEAVNGDAVQNIRSKLENRYMAVYTDFSQNAPDMLSIVENCNVNIDGNYVTLFISEKSADMYSFFKSKL